MNKFVFVTLFLTTLLAEAMAQQRDAIIKKYINDTTGFTIYPDTSLLGHIKPASPYKQIEINEVIFPYRVNGDNRAHYDFRNVCRYPNPLQKLPDSVVLTKPKPDPQHTFTACDCPSMTPWYMSVFTTDDSLITIGDTSAMKTFLTKIDDPYNAYLWLVLHDMKMGIPYRTWHYLAYKKVKGGFLISHADIIETAPLTTAKLTYFVSTDFKIILVSTKNVVVNKKISYKI